MKIGRTWFRRLLAASLMLAGLPLVVSAADMLVLMSGSGKVERYDSETGAHVGTVVSGLPPSNAMLFDAEGRLLISTGMPGGVGHVLRFDPRNGGKMETWLDVPEGYGGRLFRATGMTWHEGDLLVASQGDGKVKRYDGKTGEWKADVSLASPGGMTQIAVHGGRLFITDYVAQMLRRAPEALDGTMSEPWAQHAAQAPWGLVFDAEGRAYWSTAANRIHRFDGQTNVEWAGAGGGLAIPVGLTLGPDGNLYAASLHGQVTVWKTDAPNAGDALRVIGGPEMKEPISIVFTTLPRGLEFVMAPPPAAGVESAEKVAFFESKIRPLLVERCIECHGEKKQKGGLRLDSRAAWQAGGNSGKAIVPGKPDESLLIKAVRYADKDLQMPPKKALPPGEVALLVEWIQQGAVDPRSDALAAAQPASDDWAAEFQKRLDWWSLKPMRPATNGSVDGFIQAAQKAAGLAMAPQASDEVLRRRLSFVLTGLPPMPDNQTMRKSDEETEALSLSPHPMVSQSSPLEAYVDSLLSSPHFGEHFARHWMDVVRYTDTYGYEWDTPAKGAHEYRDYLIRAFNDDIGFDQLLREQLAGDLIAKPRLDAAGQINESLIGPMFYHLGEHRHGSSIGFNGVHQEMVNNKIDAFSKAFLATTVACARCHNHKLEAVSQRDYYALGAVFMVPRWTSRSVDAPGKNDVAIARLKELRANIRNELAALWKAVRIQPESWRKPLEVRDAPAAKLEDIAYPLAKLTQAEGGIEATWTALAKEWAETRAARLTANAAYTVLTDFSEPQLPAAWVAEGDGFMHGWVPDATPLIALEGEAVVARLLPRGYHTHALSSRLPGTLRMPPQSRVAGNVVSLRLAGGEFGGSLTVDENAFQSETIAFFNDPKLIWRSYGDTPLRNSVTRVTVEFATASLNPNFPPRVDLVPMPPADMGHDKRSWLSLTGIVTHDAGGTPQDTLDAFATLYQGPAPTTTEEVNARLSAWFTAAVHRWCEETSQPGDVALLDWMLTQKILPNTADASSPLAALIADYRRVESGIAFPRTVNSMDERETAKVGLPLNLRGNVDTPGDPVMPDFLQMFAGRNNVAKSPGSGRLELAESLLHPEHPLTARVYVNRVWQWIFGTGLVATPDDFGRLGDKPSHPELLDWLAREFIREGWSTKKLVRRLVLSETFRQSGVIAAAARERDPMNRLLSYYPTRRLEAESIRDSLLAVSTRLAPTLYGRPINAPRAVEDPKKRLFSGPLDGHGRRSIYSTMSIMAPPSFLTAFDLPDLKLPSGKRNITNVPSQSLMMLNDPLVSALAKHWATQLIKEPHTTVEERISAMFARAFARPPQPAELQQWTTATRDFATTPDLLHDEAAWTQLAHALFNTQEFIHYR